MHVWSSPGDRPRWAVVGVLVVLAMAFGLAACGGGGSPRVLTTTKLQVDLIPAAVAAVEASLGGSQRYTEINTTPQGVNLFVAVSDTEEVAYFFTANGLGDPGAKQQVGGTPFTLGGVSLDIGRKLVLDTQQKFPGSEVTQTSIVRTPDLATVWGLKSRSSRGGVLNVLYGPTGSLLSVAPEGEPTTTVP